MTFNTRNPIGSTDARDLSDNAKNMDYLENSTTELTHPDRLGTVRKTRHGMEVEHDAQIAAHEYEHDAQMQAFESDFDGRLAGMAFTRVGSFTTGATLTDMRQVLVWESSQGGDGHEYGWTGTFPKVVAAGATPATSGGIGAGAWVDRTQETLRSELAAIDGEKLIGKASSINELRTIEPLADKQRIWVSGYNAGVALGGGYFTYDSSNTESDDSVRVFVTAGGKRWVRAKNTHLTSYDAGYNPNDTSTHQNAIIRLCSVAAGRTVVFESGAYYYTGCTTLSNSNGGKIIFSKGAQFIKAYNNSSSLWYLRSCFYISGNNWILDGVYIDGEKATYTAASQGGIIISGNDNTITNAYIANVTGHAIGIDATIITATLGIYGLRNSVTYSSIVNPTQVGLMQYGARNTKFVGNYISGSGAEGITLDWYCKGCIVKDNNLSACATIGAVGGIGIDGSYNCIIQGNTIDGTLNNLPGICLECQTANTHHNTISGNTISNNSNYGVWLRYRTIIYPSATGDYATADYNSVSGNIFYGNTTAPIKVDANCTGNTISGNSYNGDLPLIDSTSYTTCTDANVFFNLSNNVARSSVTGDGTEYTVPFNIGNNTYTSSGVFTAPISGLYEFNWQVRFEAATTAHVAVVANLVLSNGVKFTKTSEFVSQPGVHSAGGGVSVYVPKGATVSVSVVGYGGTKVLNIPASTIDSYFSGVMIK